MTFLAFAAALALALAFALALASAFALAWALALSTVLASNHETCATQELPSFQVHFVIPEGPCSWPKDLQVHCSNLRLRNEREYMPLLPTGRAA